MPNDFYYYKLLDKKEKSLYKTMFTAIQSYTPKLQVGFEYTTNQILNVANAILDDNPTFYYFEQLDLKIWKGIFGLDIILSYTITIEEKEKYDKVINASIKKIIDYTENKAKNDYEKVKIIHNLLARELSYATEWLKNNNGMEFVYAHTILGVFYYKKSICDGMAKAFKLLLNIAGIKCIVVSGKLKENSTEHAWNIVKINNKSYHVDITNDASNSVKGNISYTFFCLSDYQISKSLYGFTNVPACNYNDLDYFILNNISFTSEKALYDYLSKTAVTVPFLLYFRLDYESPKDFESQITDILNYINKLPKSNNNININTKFNIQQKVVKILGQIRE